MIKCINSNIEIYSDGNYNYNNWNLINNNGIFNSQINRLMKRRKCHKLQ